MKLTGGDDEDKEDLLDTVAPLSSVRQLKTYQQASSLPYTVSFHCYSSSPSLAKSMSLHLMVKVHNKKGGRDGGQFSSSNSMQLAPPQEKDHRRSAASPITIGSYWSR
eukprot:scaffold2642_cov183-Ochromonas_danica.AAC.2